MLHLRNLQCFKVEFEAAGINWNLPDTNTLIRMMNLLVVFSTLSLSSYVCKSWNFHLIFEKKKISPKKWNLKRYMWHNLNDFGDFKLGFIQRILWWNHSLTIQQCFSQCVSISTVQWLGFWNKTASSPVWSCVRLQLHFYTSTKSWRGYIFTSVCLCVCVCVRLCLWTKFHLNG